MLWRRPKIRRQNRIRSSNGRTHEISDEFANWKAPKGVVTPTRRELKHAMDSIPDDLSWEWAKERLVPVLERPGSDPFPQDPQLSAVADCGVSYGFGIEIGPGFARVNRGMATRWDRPDEVIRDVALANLRRRLYDEDPTFETVDVPKGAVVVRLLTKPQGFASSVLLVPDALRRIFGDADQVFTAPSRPVLLAFPPDATADEIELVTREMEELDQHPLLLDPFRLTGGQLRWDGLVPAIREA
jgi:hypothetical protein